MVKLIEVRSMPTDKGIVLQKIKAFTNEIDANHLRYVDCFAAKRMVLFMPVAGPCLLAITPKHTHKAALFVVNFADTSSIVLGNTTYRSQPNTVSYIPPHVPHHEINEAAIPRYVAILVEPQFLEEQANAYTTNPLDLGNWKTFATSNELISSIKRFVRECQTPQAGTEALLDAYSVETVHNLLRCMMGIKTENNVYTSRIEINRCIEFMRQNLSDKLTLTSLACYSGMSVSQFTRVFRKETGLSPIDYLIDMRLEVACRLLLGEAMPLKQIAMDCGFSSPAHFSSSFQKKFNTSPSTYLHASTPR